MNPTTKPGEADLTALRKEPHDGEGGADIEFREGWNACLDRIAALGTAPATPVPTPRPTLPQEREAAEQEYIGSVFDLVSDPIGSRDWTLYFAGWLARSTTTRVPTPVQPVPALPELWHAANAVVHMLPQIDEPRTSRLYAALRDAGVQPVPASEPKECRHCGFLCAPNNNKKRAWYPLATPTSPAPAPATQDKGEGA